VLPRRTARRSVMTRTRTDVDADSSVPARQLAAKRDVRRWFGARRCGSGTGPSHSNSNGVGGRREDRARLVDDAEMRATVQKRVAALKSPRLSRLEALGRDDRSRGRSNFHVVSFRMSLGASRRSCGLRNLASPPYSAALGALAPVGGPGCRRRHSAPSERPPQRRCSRCSIR
jgi:hypothetical protein